MQLSVELYSQCHDHYKSHKNRRTLLSVVENLLTNPQTDYQCR